MKSRKERIRTRFQVESLEGRIALSSLGGGGADDAIHGHRHRGGLAAEIQMHRRGLDDPANHNANDNRGVARGRRGLDDPANHNANDNRGVVNGRRGLDDPANHNANDDRGGRRGGHR
jgi:hypothetical protein